MMRKKSIERSFSREEKKEVSRKPPIPHSGSNYGELLYKRGIKQKEELEMNLREARSELLRQEVDQVTFHPKINSRTNSLERSPRTEDILFRYGEKREEKLEL